MPEKPWYQSRAQLGLLLTAFTIIAGYSLPEGLEHQQYVDLIIYGGQLLGLAITAVGNIFRKTTISKTKVLPGIEIRSMKG